MTQQTLESLILKYNWSYICNIGGNIALVAKTFKKNTTGLLSFDVTVVTQRMHIHYSSML